MQQSKIAVTGQPIKVFNNGNMFIPWNAKQIPPGVRDFTYVDDIVEGVVRVIDNPPVQSQLGAGVSEGSLPAEEKRRQGTTEAAPCPQRRTPYKIYNIGNSSSVPLMEYI